MTRKEAIEKIRKWDFLNDEVKEAIEVVCPELAESEDERIRKSISNYINATLDDNESVEKEKWLAWLEKQGEQSIKMRALLSADKLASAEMTGRLKERKEITDNPEKYGLCKKPAWSEEDERMCQETIDWFEKKCFPYALEEENPAKDSINWFKSLKDRVQPQKEWSEDDEVVLDNIIDFLNSPSTAELCPTLRNDAITWLESLKPKPQWKPSDEQVKQLKSAADIYPDSRLGHALKSLYQDLKKLKG